MAMIAPGTLVGEEVADDDGGDLREVGIFL